MDDEMQAFDMRDREIELRLDAFARVRLSPDPQAVARSRARIMREARLQFEVAAGQPSNVVPLAAIHRRPVARRLAMPILAASVWLGVVVGSVAAAQPGGPLYGTRMWVENAALPSDGAARAASEISRLEARLTEALSAAGRGDTNAVQAALAAYAGIADQAMTDAGVDPGLEALLAGALDKHRVVLTAVGARLTEQGNTTAATAVEASIQRAIVHNQAVIDRIELANDGGTAPGVTGKPGPATGGTDVTGTGSGTGAGTSGGGTGGGGTGGGTGGTGTGGAGTGGGGTGGKPSKPPKPTPTAAATPLTEQPERTPRGPRD